MRTDQIEVNQEETTDKNAVDQEETTDQIAVNHEVGKQCCRCIEQIVSLENSF